MWKEISRFILKNRIFIVLLIIGATIYFGYHATKVKMSYDLVRMLPETDSTSIEYQEFKKRFGEDGNILVIGVTNPNMFNLRDFKAWYDLGVSIKETEGVEEVASICRLINLRKDTVNKQFIYEPILKDRPETQEQVDSLKSVILNLPFYEGMLYNKQSNAYVMAITLDKNKLNDKIRTQIVGKINSLVQSYSNKLGVKTHFSGLPYIRTVTTEKVKDELKMFVILSILVTCIVLVFFFRSLKAVIFPLIIVGIGVIWTLGMVQLFDYKITILTGIIPSLLIVIGMENCIYLLNNYHTEYKSHGHKLLALSMIIRKIGKATFLTNATTATGFFSFIFTSSNILKEFGVIASLNIFALFILTLLLIPTLYSFLPAPKERHTKHIDNPRLSSFLDRVVRWVVSYRVIIYSLTVVLIAVGLIGVFKMQSSGKIVDDMPKSDPIYVDLKYFEQNFKGVMPFEIAIDTKKPNGVMRLGTLRKISQLQDSLAQFSELAKPLSIVEALKFTKQAYYFGDPTQYAFPNSYEGAFILSYLPKNQNKSNQFHSFIDSTKRFTRMSIQMADVGTNRMNEIKSKIRPMIDSIFSPDDYSVTVTGNSLVYTKGTEFLITNLYQSLIMSVIIISLLMAMMCNSARMVAISLIPNLIPQLITAAIMGFFDIPIKPSTIIIFSIALGISVDNAIHFLSKYRLELKHNNWDIKLSVSNTIKETGVSMIYTSVVLLFGFGIFMASGFGGTKALGMLVSTTLFIAIFGNMILLPALLLSLDRNLTTKVFSEPIIDIYEEEDEQKEENLEKNLPIEQYKEEK